VRVAALYDVHGNLPALDAVLAQVPDDAVILVGGDVAAGPLPGDTLERLRGLGDRVQWIRGNADRELTPGEPAMGPPDVLSWVRDRLSAEQIEFLHGLPERVELEVDGLGSVLFCHATPRNDVDIFLEGTPEEHVGPLFDGVDADTVVCGHTHMQFVRVVAGIRVVNAGSVGMPYEDDPGAYWALLGPRVEHRRTQYDESVLADTEFPAPYFSGQRPSRAETAEYFAKFAVGA
jgi:putative phosphoesterase